MKDPRRLVSKPDTGSFYEIGIKARLIWRLMQDGRVNPFLKLLPLGSLLYLLNPFDIIGPLDDAFVIWLGSVLFLEMAPLGVVEEHRAELEPAHKKSDDESSSLENKDIIDAEFTE